MTVNLAQTAARRLANLEHAARAWRRVLDVDPRVATLIEGQRDRELERAA